MALHVLDNYYLAITLLITIAYQLFFFTIAFSFKFDKLTDFAGGTNFVVLAIITLSFYGSQVDHIEARQVVCSVFIILWGARLSAFLLFRILKTGKDDRFDDKRDKFFSFLGFWVLQMIWVWTVSLPVTILNSPAVTQYPQTAFGEPTDILGCISFTLAFVIEAWSDIQKYMFKNSAAGKEPGAICDVGLFAWSRHPNYFGEIIVQATIYMIAVTPAAWVDVPPGSGAYAALYASCVGFIFLTALLLFVSGLTLQERPGAKKRYEKGTGWPAYEKYLHDTSILIPMPQAIWRNLPVWVKRTVGCEWPIYVFDPAKHADTSKTQERQAEEGQSGSDGKNRSSSEPMNR